MALTKAELYAELRAPEPGTKAFTRVKGARAINLAPTLTKSGGGREYKRGGMEHYVATLDEVQKFVKGAADAAYARAIGLLETVRAAAKSFGIGRNWVHLDLNRGVMGTDYLLTLTDTKQGAKGAMSIEYGREDYLVERDDGRVDFIGGMTGKFILHRAFRVSPSSLQGTGGGSF